MELTGASSLFPDPAKRLYHIKVKKKLCRMPEPHDYIKGWLKRMESQWEEYYKQTAYRRPRFEKGDVLEGGFKPFLSNYGHSKYLVRSNGTTVNFDTLEGKFLLIFCFSLPLGADSSGADYCRALINSYPTFASNGFEMVLVADMEPGFPDDESLFDRFFSAFPCLAIPFRDRHTRLSICSSILTHNGLLLNPKGLVLESHSTLSYLCTYGTDWLHYFFDTWKIDESELEKRSYLDPLYTFNFPKCVYPISLWHDILFCDPYLLLKRCDQAAATTVEHLSRKYVGLYLCVDGTFLEKLKEAHDHCLVNNQELEIVVVCMSTFDNPISYMKDLHEALALFNIKSWFLYEPCDNICRRIYRIYGQSSSWPGDRFIIVPPNAIEGELEGKEVISLLGIKEYPFTRTTILQRRFDALKSLNIHSLLSNSSTCLLLKGEKYQPQLENKKLLIYVAPLVRGPKDPTEVKLENHYNDMKARGWEVVYIPLDAKYTSHRHPLPSSDEMPWPYMSLSDAIRARVVEQLIFPEEDDCTYVIGVGEDGTIRSRAGEMVLETEGLTDSLFNDNLYQELGFRLSALAAYLEHK